MSFSRVFVSLTLAILALTAFAPSSVSAASCRALALSGGGDKGAYEAGVLQGLVENMSVSKDEHSERTLGSDTWRPRSLGPGTAGCAVGMLSLCCASLFVP